MVCYKDNIEIISKPDKKIKGVDFTCLQFQYFKRKKWCKIRDIKSEKNGSVLRMEEK